MKTLIKRLLREELNDAVNQKILSIGSFEQYNKYLETIFPSSIVKDVVYHGTMEQLIPKDKFKGYVTYFTTDVKYAKTFGFPVNRKIVSAKINIQSPYYADSELADVPREIHLSDAYTNPRIIKAETKGYDSVIGTDAGQTEGKTIAVFEPNQIHILGSEKDIKMFSDFMGKSKSLLSRFKL